MKKILFSLFAFCLLILPSTAMAADFGITKQTDDFGITGTNGLETNMNGGLNLSSKNPVDSVISIINLLISFLGIGALIIILIGGFKWMTSMGNQDSIKKAKSLLIAGIIGLVIILAAWGLARFIVMRLSNSIAGI